MTGNLSQMDSKLRSGFTYSNTRSESVKEVLKAAKQKAYVRKASLSLTQSQSTADLTYVISSDHETGPLLQDSSSSSSLISTRNTVWNDMLNFKDIVLEQYFLNSLLLVLPFAIMSNIFNWDKVIVFILNFIVIIPLANMLGIATEELALRTGETVGGLLNATFGNAVELILSIAALQKGLISVVQGSLLGSILSNLLLVMGLCFLCGGLKYKEQTFNMAGAGTLSTLMLLSCVGLSVPCLFHYLRIYQTTLDNNEKEETQEELIVSRCIAIVLGIVYILYLFFQLKTHAHLFESEPSDNLLPNSSSVQENSEEVDGEEPMLSIGCSTLLLIVVTCVVAYCSELLTGSIESMSAHISETFIGVILLPIVGNAAEHLTAVTVAVKNKMDLSIGVAVGSSVQIALLVVPVITIAGWVIDQPMDLNFEVFNTGLLILTVLIVNLTLQDGQSNWLEGTMLVGTYLIIAIACFFNHTNSSKPHNELDGYSVSAPLEFALNHSIEQTQA